MAKSENKPKIPRKQAEGMIEAMVEMGTFTREEADVKLQELVTNGAVSSGQRLGAPRTDFASPEQKKIYEAGKSLLAETREFWKTNKTYQYLQSKKVTVGVEDDNGTLTGTTEVCVEPSVALKNNRVVIASFDVIPESTGIPTAAEAQQEAPEEAAA